MNKYLIEFILNLIVGTMAALVIPLIAYIAIKDFRVKKRIRNSRISYINTIEKLSGVRTFFHYLSLLVMGILFVGYVIFIQLPVFADVPSLITGHLLYSEGVVTSVKNNRSQITIYISNIEVNESTWFKSQISPNKKYRISYLKYSKYIIKAEQIE